MIGDVSFISDEKIQVNIGDYTSEFPIVIRFNNNSFILLKQTEADSLAFNLNSALHELELIKDATIKKDARTLSTV